jgi:hypothetical protein
VDKKDMNTQANKEQCMFTLVGQWRSSELKRDEFCRHHQINVSTFNYWIIRKKVPLFRRLVQQGLLMTTPH